VILDDEVFAVIIAITAVASVFAAAQILYTGRGEEFIALGLLNSDCRIGDYPSSAANGSYLDLCIYIYNHMGRPIYYKIVYRIGSKDELPTNTTPSRAPELAEWRGVLGVGDNSTFRVRVPVYASAGLPANATLIFEAWVYSTSNSSWVYSGVWNHLHIAITPRRA